MTWTIIFGTLGALSVILNGVLIWYTSKILSKLLYTADNLGDLYVVFASFKTFVSSLYQMDMFHGEPVIQELITRIKNCKEEIERFEDIYELTTLIDEEELIDDEYEEDTKTQEEN